MHSMEKTLTEQFLEIATKLRESYIAYGDAVRRGDIVIPVDAEKIAQAFLEPAKERDQSLLHCDHDLGDKEHGWIQGHLGRDRKSVV